MSVEFDRGSPGKFDSRTLGRETLSRWTGRIQNVHYALYIIHLSISMYQSIYPSIYLIYLSLCVYIYTHMHLLSLCMNSNIINGLGVV